MEMVSSVYAALGVVEFDVLTDLAGWLDGCVDAIGGTEASPADQAVRAAGHSGGGEG